MVIEGKKVNEKSDFHDLDYSFRDNLGEEAMDNNVMPKAMVVVNGEASWMASDVEIESDYVGSKELHLCSSTNKKE